MPIVSNLIHRQRNKDRCSSFLHSSSNKPGKLVMSAPTVLSCCGHAGTIILSFCITATGQLPIPHIYTSTIIMAPQQTFSRCLKMPEMQTIPHRHHSHCKIPFHWLVLVSKSLFTEGDNTIYYTMKAFQTDLLAHVLNPHDEYMPSQIQKELLNTNH